MINKIKFYRGVFVDDFIGEIRWGIYMWLVWGEYICDYYMCDILYYIVGKNVFILSFVYWKVFVVYINYMYRWYI